MRRLDLPEAKMADHFDLPAARAARRTASRRGASCTATASAIPLRVGLHARAAYEVPFQRWYLRPTLDPHAAYVRMDSYSESGAAPFNLDVDSSDKVFFAAAPTLELGTRFDLADGSTLRAFASGGAAFFADNDWHAEASFQLISSE